MKTYKLLTELNFLHSNHAFSVRQVSRKEFEKQFVPTGNGEYCNYKN
jgi:hypothetical protein